MSHEQNAQTFARKWGKNGNVGRHVGAVSASRRPRAIGRKLVPEHRLGAHSHLAPIIPRETSYLIHIDLQVRKKHELTF